MNNEQLDELLEYLHSFDDLHFTCTRKDVIDKIWQIQSKSKPLENEIS